MPHWLNTLGDTVNPLIVGGGIRTFCDGHHRWPRNVTRCGRYFARYIMRLANGAATPFGHAEPFRRDRQKPAASAPPIFRRSQESSNCLTNPTLPDEGPNSPPPTFSSSSSRNSRTVKVATLFRSKVSTTYSILSFEVSLVLLMIFSIKPANGPSNR